MPALPTIIVRTGNANSRASLADHRDGKEAYVPLRCRRDAMFKAPIKLVHQRVAAGPRGKCGSGNGTADRPHHAAPTPAQLRGIPRFLEFVPEWIRSLPHLGMLQD